MLPDAADVLGAWDFSRDTSSDTIFDIGPNRLHGVIVNQPTRAMRGHNWTGEYSDWRQAPDQYGAIHFHDDDLVDACWESDFAYTIPDGLRSGVYAVRLDSGGFDYWMPFFVRPPRGTATSKVAFLASTATYTVYLNNRGRFMSLATERTQGRLMFMDAIDELLVTDTTMGLSTYDRHSDGSGVAYSSRHRPLQNFRPTGRHWNFNLDLFIIDWLEHLGGDYDVITEEDLHREGLDLLRPYQVVLTGSHPEYDFAGNAGCHAGVSTPGWPLHVYGRQRLLLAHRPSSDARRGHRGSPSGGRTARLERPARRISPQFFRRIRRLVARQRAGAAMPGGRRFHQPGLRSLQLLPPHAGSGGPAHRLGVRRDRRRR